MIVKVSKGPGRWEYLTDVRNVDLDLAARLATSKQELDCQVEALKVSANGKTVRNLISEIDWSQPSSPRRIGAMVLELRDDSREFVLFDGLVYLCDDRGQTVDKVVLR